MVKVVGLTLIFLPMWQSCAELRNRSCISQLIQGKVRIMFGGEKGAKEVKGAGPLPLPPHKSYPSQRLVEPSLSRWTPNPASLPPARGGSNLQPPTARLPPQTPTVPPRTHNSDTDNWVDLEELYRWLQELEDTRVPSSDDDKKCGKATSALHADVCMINNLCIGNCLQSKVPELGYQL